VTFPLCNFLNKNHSNVSPVNLQPHTYQFTATHVAM
jgi:hypothetical protein